MKILEHIFFLQKRRTEVTIKLFHIIFLNFHTTSDYLEELTYEQLFLFEIRLLRLNFNSWKDVNFKYKYRLITLIGITFLNVNVSIGLNLGYLHFKKKIKC